MHDANAICHFKAIPHYREEDRKEMENQIQELLEKKLIRPSNGPHHAPAFLVRNHTEQLKGKARMVIDYRDVNKKTIKDGYQITQVRVLINMLKRAKIFSKFDAKSGFWQVTRTICLTLLREKWRCLKENVAIQEAGNRYQRRRRFRKDTRTPSERIKPRLDQGWDDLLDHSKKDANQSITDDEERIAKEFLLCPKGTASTDRSQGKRSASPSQTADGKGISSPFMAVALPKSRNAHFRANKLPLVTEKKVVHDQPLKIFQKPVFRTERLLASKQKIIIDNILHAFYEENEAHLLQTLKALTEELYGFHIKDKNIQAESQAGNSRAVYLENPKSAKIPMVALKEFEWYKFHNLLGEAKDVLPRTLSVV
ncbi:hypothetical protein ACLB2K_021481 [Fragaria x ananassa]